MIEREEEWPEQFDTAEVTHAIEWGIINGQSLPQAKLLADYAAACERELSHLRRSLDRIRAAVDEA